MGVGADYNEKVNKRTSGTRLYSLGNALAVTATSAQSDALDSGVSEVMLHATKAMFVINGANPTVAGSGADAVGIPLEDGEKLHIRVNEGDKIAAIRKTADGTLYIIPVVSP